MRGERAERYAEFIVAGGRPPSCRGRGGVRVAGSDLDFLSALVQRTDALKILMPGPSAVRRSSSVSYPCVLVTLLSSVVRV